MVKLIRTSLVLFAILLASTMALVGTSGVAAARSNHADHKDRKVHKDLDGKQETRKQSRHRKKHKKKAIVCIKAPCPGDGARHDDDKRRASEDKQKKDKCGTLILPTAGCGTPARDPVGTTRPTLPERTKQPLEDGRKPVLENVR